MAASGLPGLPDYAELHALSNFSFQRGASHAQELVERAAQLGYRALAITDECSVSGVVRAHVAAKAVGLQLLPGAEFYVQAPAPGTDFRLVVLPHNAEGWGNLCEFITAVRAAGDVLEKGSYRAVWGETDFDGLRHCEVIVCPLPGAIDGEALQAISTWAVARFGGHSWLAVELLQGLDDALRLHQLQQVARHCGIALVAAGSVLMQVRSRKPLHDVLTAIRLGCTVHDGGRAFRMAAVMVIRV